MDLEVKCLKKCQTQGGDRKLLKTSIIKNIREIKGENEEKQRNMWKRKENAINECFL